MRSLLLLFCFVPAITFAGNEADPAGARSAGMAHTYLTQRDIWSIYHNQAGLAYIDRATAGAFFENKFFINDLGYGGFAGAIPLGNGSIGLSYSSLGFSSYNEGKLGLAYGMKVSESIAIGTQLNYHHISIGAEDYGKTNALTAELGFSISLSERVSLAAHVFNITRTKLNDFNDERIPTILRFGAGYKISDEVMLTGEVEKDIDKTEIFKGGIEYRPVEILYIRLGAASSPGLFAFGLGLDFKSFQLDLASTYHSVLGYSPQISLTYAPGKK